MRNGTETPSHHSKTGSLRDAARPALANETGMFTGFPREGLRFLEALAKHNERAWFTPRKDEYERTVLAPMRAFVADASAALRAARIPIGGSERRSIFRVYRDMRFAADKSPYRTHVAAYLSYDGGRATPGGLYCRSRRAASRLSSRSTRSSGRCCSAGAARWRARRRAFAPCCASCKAAGLELGEPEDWDDSLARMPRGFEALRRQRSCAVLPSTLVLRVAHGDAARRNLAGAGARAVEFARESQTAARVRLEPRLR